MSLFYFIFQIDDMFKNLGLSSFSGPPKNTAPAKSVNTLKNMENTLMNDKTFPKVLYDVVFLCFN